MANYYETLFIVRPNADAEAVQGAIAATREHITAAGGEVLFESELGKRRLAYEVADHTEGIYVQFNFSAPPTYPPTLERAFRLSEDVIRSLVLRTDGPPPPPEEQPNYLRVDAEGETAPDETGGEHRSAPESQTDEAAAQPDTAE